MNDPAFEACSSGLLKESETEDSNVVFIMSDDGARGISILEEIDLEMGWSAVRVHTYEAKCFWILLHNGHIKFITNSAFDVVKKVCYSLRRVALPASGDTKGKRNLSLALAFVDAEIK